MSVSFSWNTATSVPLLNLSREERAFGWPASFSLKRIALLQYPDLDPAEPDNWRVRKSQDVLEQALRQAVLSGSLDAIAKAKLVERDSVARGDDGVQRIVQGTRTVETHEIAALALLNWFNEQDITPSEHMRAWFDATGASFAVLWKEKNEKYVHPGEEADRFTERSFLEGYEDVTDKVRGLQRKQGQSPVRREEATPERCAELAGLERFKAADWIALTGIGLGKFGHYRISTEGVRFLEWKEEEREADGNSTYDQEHMLRDNDVPALSFPCTADELIAFVDSETADGTRFLLPEAFRKTLVERCHIRDRSLPDIAQHAEVNHSQSGLRQKDPDQAPALSPIFGNAPATEEVSADHDAALAELFDPVSKSELEAMFPDGGKWRSYKDHAKANGLIAARVGRGKFNPYLAALWWLKTKSPSGWDWSKCIRKLANNLPARSRDLRHMLTGNYD